MERLEDYKKINKIGQGTFGTVYEALNLLNGKTYALKYIKHDNKGIEINCYREIEILQQLSHTNIIKLHCIIPSDKGLCLVLEFGGYDLAYQYDHLNLNLTEFQIKFIMKQLLLAVAYLHQHSIIHRDLKPSNMLLEKNLALKICDFGLSRIIRKNMTSGIVTLWYRAPEVLLGVKEYTTAVDMWSIGCIFAEMLNMGSPVMPGKNTAHQLQMICKLIGAPNARIWPQYEELAGRMRIPENSYNTLNVQFGRYSRECVDFLNNLLVWDPAERLSAAEALLSSYILSN